MTPDPITLHSSNRDAGVQPNPAGFVESADPPAWCPQTPQCLDHTAMLADYLGARRLPEDAYKAQSEVYSGPIHRVNSIHRIGPFGMLVNRWRPADVAAAWDAPQGDGSPAPPDGKDALKDINRLGGGRLTFHGESLPFGDARSAAGVNDAAMDRDGGIGRFKNVRALKNYVLTKWLAHIEGPTPPDHLLDGDRPLQLTGRDRRLVLLDNVLEHVHQGAVAGYANISVATDRMDQHGLMPLDPEMRIEIQPIEGGLRIFSVAKITRMHRTSNAQAVEILDAPPGKCLASTEIEFHLLLEKAGEDADQQPLYKCALYPVSAYSDIYDVRVKAAFDDAFGFDLDDAAGPRIGDGFKRSEDDDVGRMAIGAAIHRPFSWLQSLVDSLLAFLHGLLRSQVEVEAEVQAASPVDVDPSATRRLPAKRQAEAFDCWASTQAPRPTRDGVRR